MRITKQTSYAIRILIHCAIADTPARASDIARLYGISEYNVTKIIPLLARGGFLITKRGRHGGLRLARPPEDIGIGALLRLTEVTHVEADCVGGASIRCAVRRTAPINQVFGEAMKAFISVLDKHTLADLISSRPSAPISLNMAADGQALLQGPKLRRGASASSR
jgi:Rrf2 family protein